MKKVLLFILCFSLLACFFISSASAADPYIPPVFEEGDPNDSGWWSPITGNIVGTFTTWMQSEVDVENRPYYTGGPWQILRDERDENGIGIVYWILNVTFSEGFGYNSQLLNYQTIQIVLRSYDTEPQAYLNDLTVLDYYGHEEAIFRYSHDPAVPSYYEYQAYLYFGLSGQNHPYLDDWGTEFLLRFYIEWFSGPYVNGGIYQQAGFFKPVVFSSFVPDDPGSGDDAPQKGFSAFMTLIFETFRDLLSIDFFAGFFSLGDILGVIVAFAMIGLFIKWFAGG